VPTQLRFDPDKPQYLYVKTPEQVDEALTDLEKEKVVGIDTEATSLDPITGKLLCVQIGGPVKSYIFDARYLDLKSFPRLISFLQDSSRIKLFHNGKFDFKYIKINLGVEVANLYDSMLAEAVLNAGIGSGYYSLKSLVKKYADLDLEKGVRKSFMQDDILKQTLNEEQLIYSALDTLVLFPVFEAQIQQLNKESLMNVAKLEFAATRVVANMELAGLYIDKLRWEQIIKNMGVKRDELARKFQDSIRPYYNVNMVDLFGNTADVINMNSQQQLMDLFNNRLKLNMPSTGDAVLASFSHPVAKLLRDYRGYEKLISAFGDSLLSKINPVTHRIHPEFNQLGAATGRFSCNNPNLQQIPRNSPEAPFRECINPEPGYKLVDADYSNFEMRVLADLSGDEKMLTALNTGLDIHSYTAALMFNLPYTDTFKKEHPDLRQIAKPIGFGLMYGMGPMGLARRLETEVGRPFTKEEGQEYMDKYFSSYPSVRGYLDKVAKDAVARGYSITPGGRKRWYHKPDKSDPEYRMKISQIEREAKNHPIQGTNADAIKYALVYVQERMRKEGIDGKITLCVHDEIMTEVREDQAEAWAPIQAEEMVRAAKLFLHRVKITSEPNVGDVWEH
jgi:DNA polymerase I-like protein with 3'-5' exonuclease and polymerase domains